MSRRPIVAIIGRPNVGKSTLFNMLAGERISIVHNQPGITRDRIHVEAEWLGRALMLIDTGGIEPQSTDELLVHMREQAEIAIDTADLILFLTDLKSGLSHEDLAIADLLRKSGKPVVVAVNKVDQIGDPPAEMYEFYQLGFEVVLPISAAHKLGLGELMDVLVEKLPKLPDRHLDDERIKIAIIGRPNAGKSSLVNYLLGEHRTIVSPVAGTTRDAIDADLDCNQGKFRLIDTAGLRKRSRFDSQIEHYAMVRTLAAIERADVCLIVMDATAGVTEQDTRVAGLAHNAGKASILVMNKWDLVEKETGTLEHQQKTIETRFGYMRYAPVVFTSALTGQRVGSLLDLAGRVYRQAGQRLTTGVLNELLLDAVAMNPTPQDKGRHLKIYYMTQVSVYPPTFVLFVNDRELTHFSYERYLENQIRANFDFTGTPIRLIWRNRTERDALERRRRR